ncbi:MAG: hypothetical protein ACJAY8_001277 [Sphingobacteriales bacterium]|jgi:uncharacterized protein YqeY
MGLIDQIGADMKDAMRAKEKERLNAIRAIKSELLLQKTKDPSVEITQEDEIKILQKLKKQRLESAEVYTGQERPDLAEVELVQAEIITAYLPAQLDGEALVAEVQKIIDQIGATGPGDMGKVMGAASKALTGKAAGKDISTAVKAILNS